MEMRFPRGTSTCMHWGMNVVSRDKYLLLTEYTWYMIPAILNPWKFVHSLVLRNYAVNVTTWRHAPWDEQQLTFVWNKKIRLFQQYSPGFLKRKQLLIPVYTGYQPSYMNIHQHPIGFARYVSINSMFRRGCINSLVLQIGSIRIIRSHARDISITGPGSCLDYWFPPPRCIG